MKKIVILFLFISFQINVRAQNKSSIDNDDILTIQHHPPKNRIFKEFTTSKFSSKDGAIQFDYKCEIPKEETDSQEQYENDSDRIMPNGEFYGDGSENPQYLQGVMKIKDVAYLVYGQYVAEGNYEAVLYKLNKKFYAIADWYLFNDKIVLNLKTDSQKITYELLHN